MTDLTDRTIDLTDLGAVVDAHLAGYCEPDPGRRRDLLAAVWTGDGELLDPPIDGRGVEAIAGLVDIVLAHYPGHRFERTTVVDAHHGHARYGWRLVGPDGTVAVEGLDVARVDEGGRLASVVGFFGPLEALAS